MEQIMPVLMNPDCLDQKHRACSGDGWCKSTDQAVPCPCVCHRLDVPPTEVYKTAPNGLNELLGYQTAPWQSPDEFRTADTTGPLPPLAYMGCCSSIVRLTRTSPGHYTGTETHLDHCPDTGAFLLPETKEDS